MAMLDLLAQGWEQAGGGPVQVLHLADPVQFRQGLAAFPKAGTVMLGMPLYTDAMPALVLAWIHALAAALAGLPDSTTGTGPVLGFLVQSGFPEALHCRPLERYLCRLAPRLGCACAGVIVRGAGESLRTAPDGGRGQLGAQLAGLGGQLARDGRFRPEALRAFRGLERFPRMTGAVLALVLRLVPAARSHWNRDLRRNGAWDQRFAAPYGPAFRSRVWFRNRERAAAAPPR